MEAQKFDFLFKFDFFSMKVEIEVWPVLKSRNHPNFGSTVVIFTLFERFSRVLKHGNTQKNYFLFKKCLP